MRELREIPALRTALEDARDYTLQLYAHLTPEQRRFPRLLSVNPPAWELAHMGWFQEFWCLRFRDRDEPLPARLPDADALLNSSIIPHAQRWDLPELTWERVLDYLAREFQDTLAALEQSEPDQRYFFQLALLHEDMHGEALLMSLQTLGLPEPQWHRRRYPARSRRPADSVERHEVEFEGGELDMGSPPAPRLRIRQREAGAPRDCGALRSRLGPGEQCGVSAVRGGGWVYPSALLDRGRMAMAHRSQLPRHRATGARTAPSGWCAASTSGSRWRRMSR